MLPAAYPYQPSTWRARSAVLRATLSAGLSTLLFAALVGWGIYGLLHTAVDERRGMLCGWGIIIAAAALIWWQALLALSNALVVTASFSLGADGLTILLAGRWPVCVARVDIAAVEAFPVWYRLGRLQRIKAPIIRPRRRMPVAMFVPLRRVERLGVLFWAVARMYAGRQARYGFLVTPDHQHGAELLEALRR